MTSNNYSPLSNQSFNLFAQESMKNKSTKANINNILLNASSSKQLNLFNNTTQNTPQTKFSRNASPSPNHAKTFNQHKNFVPQPYNSENAAYNVEKMQNQENNNKQCMLKNFGIQLNDTMNNLNNQEILIKKSSKNLKSQFSDQIEQMNEFLNFQKKQIDIFREEKLDEIRDYFTSLDQQYQTEINEIKLKKIKLQNFDKDISQNNIIIESLDKNKFENVISKYQAFLDECKAKIIDSQKKTYKLIQINSNQQIIQHNENFKNLVEQFFCQNLVNNRFIEPIIETFTEPQNRQPNQQRMYSSNKNIATNSQKLNTTALSQKFFPKTTKSIEVNDDHHMNDQRSRNNSNNASIIINQNVEQKENFGNFGTNGTNYRNTLIDQSLDPNIRAYNNEKTEENQFNIMQDTTNYSKNTSEKRSLQNYDMMGQKIMDMQGYDVKTNNTPEYRSPQNQNQNQNQNYDMINNNMMDFKQGNGLQNNYESEKEQPIYRQELNIQSPHFNNKF